MINWIKTRSALLLKIGVALIATSYILWAPMFLFLAIGLHSNPAVWCRLAGATYIISWILFISGFLLAGPDAAKSVRCWFTRFIKPKESANTISTSET